MFLIEDLFTFGEIGAPGKALLRLGELLVGAAGAHRLQAPVCRCAGVATLPPLIADGIAVRRLGADVAADIRQFGGNLRDDEQDVSKVCLKCRKSSDRS